MIRSVAVLLVIRNMRWLKNTIQWYQGAFLLNISELEVSFY